MESAATADKGSHGRDGFHSLPEAQGGAEAAAGPLCTEEQALLVRVLSA